MGEAGECYVRVTNMNTGEVNGSEAFLQPETSRGLFMYVTMPARNLNVKVEVVVMIFITTFIPSLIELGRPPASLDEVWVPFLVALLMSSYAYMRMRGIEPEPPE